VKGDHEQRWPDEPDIATEWSAMGTERWPDEPPAVAGDATVPVGIDPETGRRFIAAAVYANIALASLAIGGLLAGARGEWGWGATAVAVGLLALLQLSRIVRTQTQE
jgi:hypothetical protein